MTSGLRNENNNTTNINSNSNSKQDHNNSSSHDNTNNHDQNIKSKVTSQTNSRSSSQAVRSGNNLNQTPNSSYAAPSNSSSPNDRRQIKGRFGWVKRLMQNRQNGIHNAQQKSTDHRSQVPIPAISFSNAESTFKKVESISPENDAGSLLSDSTADNVSTTPLKSIVSFQSTKSPSILSDSHEQSSLNTSTAETSISPSAVASTTHSALLVSPQDGDNDSVVTLASSSRRIRRRSTDTNCSTNGIPPASIMERLTVHPTAANGSSYAVSIRTTERASHVDSNSYDATDLQSSAKSVEQKSFGRTDAESKEDAS